MQDQYDDHSAWAYGDYGYGYDDLDYGYGYDDLDYGYGQDAYGYDSYGYDSYEPAKTYQPYTENVWGYGPYETQYYPSYDRVATSWWY